MPILNQTQTLLNNAFAPITEIPAARIFASTARRAQQIGFRYIEAEDFVQDYLTKKLSDGGYSLDLDRYISIINARIKRYENPLTGCDTEPCKTWALNDEIDGDNYDEDDVDPDSIHYTQDACKTLEDYLEADAERAKEEKRNEFIRQIDTRRLAKRLNITPRHALDIRKAIIEKIAADYKGDGLFGFDVANIKDYIPKPKTKPAKSKAGRKKVIHQRDLFDLEENAQGDLFQGGAE